MLKGGIVFARPGAFSLEVPDFVFATLPEPTRRSNLTFPITAYAAGLFAESLTCGAESAAFTFLVSSTTAAARRTPISPNTASANKAIIRIGMACTSILIVEFSCRQHGDHGH